MNTGQHYIKIYINNVNTYIKNSSCNFFINATTCNLSYASTCWNTIWYSQISHSIHWNFWKIGRYMLIPNSLLRKTRSVFMQSEYSHDTPKLPYLGSHNQKSSVHHNSRRITKYKIEKRILYRVHSLRFILFVHFWVKKFVSKYLSTSSFKISIFLQE